ncbi:MAG: hypothetical protein A2539_08945 [Elusimicrobia bacterium RIFOXYD2_FULL_34_15]|nr:MAG: hypothetical protein A2539_08945 [Elusimicrobia bacterium RIFOXYD2_FULL_34_15]
MMKKIFCLFVLYLIPVQLTFAGPKQKAMSVAMFENITNNKEYDWIGTGFAETITSKIINIKSITVVERTKLFDILKEQKLQLSGLVDNNTAVKVGNLLAAQFVVVGSFQILGENLNVAARIVNVATAQIEKSATVEGKLEDIFGLQEKLIFEIANAIEAPVLDEEKAEISKPPAKNILAYEWFSKGKMYQYEKYKWNEAISCYKKAIKVDKNYADSFFELGNVLEIKNLHKEAFESYRDAMVLYEIKDDKLNIWRIYQNIGVIYHAQGNYNRALEYYNKALEISSKLKNQQGVNQVFNNIGLIYFSKSDYKKALEYYNKALEKNKNIGNNRDIASNYNNIGSVYDSMGNYDKAFEYAYEAFAISEKNNDQLKIAESYNLFGNIYYSKGNNKSALEYFKKALEINEKLDIKPKINDNYINIGAVNYSMLNYDEAIKNYEEALKIAEQLGNELNTARIYNNIGLVYFSNSKYDEALEYYNKSLDIKHELKDEVGEGTVMYNIALIYEGKRDFRKAIKYMENAVKIFENKKYYMLDKSNKRLEEFRKIYDKK